LDIFSHLGARKNPQNLKEGRLMARIVKESTERQNEILAAAQRLIYTKGYEQMTIQDILDDLHISKGAFYHYFDSKQALLETIITQMWVEVEKILAPITQDPNLPALVKFQRLFEASSNWKSGQKDLLWAVFKVWYNDDNALFRQKQYAASAQHLAPHFGRIIQQGIGEGVFATPFPDQVGVVVFSLMSSFGDAMAVHFLSGGPPEEVLARMEKVITVYTDAIERVLGAVPGSLKLVNVDMLKVWLVP
jgi:AcrR family transcriptional regulator